MSVELQDDEYKKLIKSANDNRAIISVVRWFVLFTLLVFVMATYGCHAIDMKKTIDKAYISAEARDIEMSGLDYDQYIEWLNATKGD